MKRPTPLLSIAVILLSSSCASESHESNADVATPSDKSALEGPSSAETNPTTLLDVTPESGDWRETWTEVPQWGGRIAYLDKRGDLFARTYGDATSAWVHVAKNVQEFQVFDWRLAVLTTDNRLLVAEGALSASFVEVDRDVEHFQMTLVNVAALRRDGSLVVHEGTANPTLVARGVKAFHVGDDRIAYLDHEDNLLMGPFNGPRFIAEKVHSFQIEREWLGYTQGPERTLMVAQGDFDDASADLSFTAAASDIADFALEVFVEFEDAGPKSSMHGAVVTKTGDVLVGLANDATELPLRSTTLTNITRVDWAGGQLSAQVQDGSRQVSQWHLDDHVLSAPESFEPTEAFALNQEGAVLSKTGDGEPKLARVMAVAPTAGATSARASSPADEPTLVSVEIDDLKLVPQGSASLAKVALSSARPDSTRRMVRAKTSDSGKSP